MYVDIVRKDLEEIETPKERTVRLVQRPVNNFSKDRQQKRFSSPNQIAICCKAWWGRRVNYIDVINTTIYPYKNSHSHMTKSHDWLAQLTQTLLTMDPGTKTTNFSTVSHWGQGVVYWVSKPPLAPSDQTFLSHHLPHRHYIRQSWTDPGHRRVEAQTRRWGPLVLRYIQTLQERWYTDEAHCIH